MYGQETIKGELQNRFNLISEERVKFCEQNSENLMKIGWTRKISHGLQVLFRRLVNPSRHLSNTNTKGVVNSKVK